MLEQNEGAEVPLQVYSTKRKEIRGALPLWSQVLVVSQGTDTSSAYVEVYVIPSRTWSSAAVPGGQAGTVDGQPSLLGLSLRVCNPQFALDQVSLRDVTLLQST